MSTVKILVVEDEKIIALDIQRNLQRLGYPLPAIASSGNEALQMVAAKQPDLVLMDIKLNGGIDGITVAEKLHHLGGNLPVVFLTSYADEATLQRAKKAGSYGYLLKPFEGRELHTTIEMALSRHQLECRLKESENHLAAILKSIGEAVIATDAQGRVKFMNPLAEKLTGWSQHESLGRDAAEIYPILNSEAGPQRTGPVISLLQPEAAAGPWQSVWLKTRAGATLPIDENITPLRDEHDNITGAVLVFKDITQRQQTEAKLYRRNRELGLLNRLISASVQTPVPEFILNTLARELALACDLPLVISLLLNDEGTTAMVVGEHGLTGEPNALSKTLTVAEQPAMTYLLTHKTPLLVKDIQDTFVQPPLRQWLGQPEVNAWLFFPLLVEDKVEDKVVGQLILGASNRDKLSEALITLMWNVADQVSSAISRARLTQGQQRLSTALEQAAESVVITDLEGAIVYVNPAFEQTTGYQAEEAIGQSCAILKSGNHDRAFYERLWHTIKGGEVWQGRLTNKKKDGTLFIEEAAISPIRNSQGDITSYVAVKRDVTRELELEEQYRQAQKIEAIGLLTAGIAHDFNNLLTAINGFAELLYNQAEPESPFQSMADSILRSGKRAADLVRQLLAFSRKQIVEPKVLNLNTAIMDIEKILRRTIGEHIQIHTHLAPDLDWIKADPTQIDQILLNLAVNARDAMPAGGQLTIETTHIMLNKWDITTRLQVEPGRYVQLTVSDTGTGMSREVQARIFDPFFTTKQVGQGTGLGLAAVYGIVKQGGGHIQVESVEGAGTTFKLYWPSTEASPPPASIYPPVYQNLSQGKETILLVEDEPAVRELLTLTLQQQGYLVLEAINGQMALQLARKQTQKIHLLITDMVMPGLTGKQLADQLTALEPDLKVLFISGYTESAFSSFGPLKNSHPVLAKPFSSQTLALKVRELLDQKRTIMGNNHSNHLW